MIMSIFMIFIRLLNSKKTSKKLNMDIEATLRLTTSTLQVKKIIWSHNVKFTPIFLEYLFRYNKNSFKFLAISLFLVS